MTNPFLDHAFHIRWSRLVTDAIEPDIKAGLEQAQAAIDALAVPMEANEPLTFGNTLLALEDATENLDLAWGRVGHLDSVRSNEALRRAYNRMLSPVSEFYAGIALNEALWKRMGELTLRSNPGTGGGTAAPTLPSCALCKSRPTHDLCWVNHNRLVCPFKSLTTIAKAKAAAKELLKTIGNDESSVDVAMTVKELLEKHK